MRLQQHFCSQDQDSCDLNGCLRLMLQHRRKNKHLPVFEPQAATQVNVAESYKAMVLINFVFHNF